MTDSNHPLNGVRNSTDDLGKPWRAHFQGAEFVMNDTALNRMEVVANQLMMSRDMLFQRLFDPRRDIDYECGYPRTTSSVAVELYKELYDREAIATRVVQVYPRECWQYSPTVYEDEDSDEPTEFEAAWDELGKGLQAGPSWHQDEEGSPVWEHLRRVDELSGIGHFGILLLGIDDGKPLDQPIDGVAVVSNGRRVHDSLVTHEEEAALRDERTWHRKVWNGKFDANGGAQVDAVPQPLTVNERLCVDGWVAQRERTNNASSYLEATRNGYRGTYNDYLGSSGMSAFAGSGTQGGKAQMANPMGTDQQYFGVQFGPSEEVADKPSTEQRKLIFLRCFDESLVQIVRYEWNVRNPRFGMPVMYRVTLNDPREQHSGIGLPLATVFVHWSRVIHVADNLGSSEIFGVPRMRPVLNRILDLRKIYGASGEGAWRGAVPQYTIESNPAMGPDVIYDREDMKQKLDNWQNSLQRILTLVGFQMKSMAPQVVDLTSHKDMHLEAICIHGAYPVRIFKGSERGELASSQDDEAWNERKRGRMVLYLTPRIIVPFIDRLIQAGVLPEPQVGEGKDGTQHSRVKASKQALGLKIDPPAAAGGGKGGPPGAAPLGGASAASPASPAAPASSAPKPPAAAKPPKAGTIPPGAKPLKNGRYLLKNQRTGKTYVFNAEGEPVGEVQGGYSVEWPELDSLGSKDKAAIALQRTQAAAAYVAGAVEQLIQPHDFLVRIMGFTEEEATAILDAALEAQADKLDEQQQMIDEQGFQPVPPPGFHDPSVPPNPVSIGPGETLVHPHTGDTLAKGQPLPKGAIAPSPLGPKPPELPGKGKPPTGDKP